LTTLAYLFASDWDYLLCQKMTVTLKIDDPATSEE